MSHLQLPSRLRAINLHFSFFLTFQTQITAPLNIVNCWLPSVFSFFRLIIQNCKNFIVCSGRFLSKFLLIFQFPPKFLLPRGSEPCQIWIKTTASQCVITLKNHRCYILTWCLYITVCEDVHKFSWSRSIFVTFIVTKEESKQHNSYFNIITKLSTMIQMWLDSNV